LTGFRCRPSCRSKTVRTCPRLLLHRVVLCGGDQEALWRRGPAVLFGPNDTAPLVSCVLRTVGRTICNSRCRGPTCRRTRFLVAVPVTMQAREVWFGSGRGVSSRQRSWRLGFGSVFFFLDRSHVRRAVVSSTKPILVPSGDRPSGPRPRWRHSRSCLARNVGAH